MGTVKVDRWELKFNVGVGKRYYANRRAFFDSMHYLTALGSALSGGTAFFSILNQSPTVALYASAIVAILSTSDLIVGFSTLSGENEALYRKYSGLAAKITRSQPTTKAQVAALLAEKQEIEADEKQRLAVVETMAYNDELRFRGIVKSYYRKVYFYQRLYCHLF